MHINPRHLVVERIQELHDRDNLRTSPAYPPATADLDQKTSGLQPGDLIIVAGRPDGETASRFR